MIKNIPCGLCNKEGTEENPVFAFTGEQAPKDAMVPLCRDCCDFLSYEPPKGAVNWTMTDGSYVFEMCKRRFRYGGEPMSEERERMKMELRDHRLRMEDVRRQKRALIDMEAMHGVAITELEKRLKDSKEVSEVEAPRNGTGWNQVERDGLEDSLRDFVYEKAIIYGRSTSAIRHKIIEFVAPKIGRGKWFEIGARCKG
jgi:transposase InsO family protein